MSPYPEFRQAIEQGDLREVVGPTKVTILCQWCLSGVWERGREDGRRVTIADRTAAGKHIAAHWAQEAETIRQEQENAYESGLGVRIER